MTDILIGTPPELTYLHPLVREAWTVVWAVASGVLVLILGWMGLSLIMQHHLGQTQNGWREMVPRLVLGLVAAATSLWWCALIIDVADAVSGFIAASLGVTAGDLLRTTLRTLLTAVEAGSVGMAIVMALLYNEALITVFDLRLLEPELRPAAAMVCTETVWAAAAQDPKPRLLVVDEVWNIMQHPEGAAFMVSMAKRARKHRLGLQFITQDVQDLLSEDTSRAITGHSGRALLQNAAFKLLLQQDAAAISTVGDAFDLPQDLQRWLLSCPRGDGLLLTKGHRFPVRIEATPEETEVIEWRSGAHG